MAVIWMNSHGGVYPFVLLGQFQRPVTGSQRRRNGQDAGDTVITSIDHDFVGVVDQLIGVKMSVGVEELHLAGAKG